MGRRFENEIENEDYEILFEDFYSKITPVINRVDGFFTDPLNRSHNLSYRLLVDMELLHMKLTTALYRLRHGEIREQFESGEIEIDEFTQLLKEINENMYKNI